jgi:hypothetical protein
MQFVAPLTRDRLGWQTQNWPYARISPTGFEPDEVALMIDEYAHHCQQAAGAGLLKKGGTSAAETVLRDILEALQVDFIEGERPEWLRNAERNLLQLDFQIPPFDLAIEVQGPHHFQDLFGKPQQLHRRKANDAFKIDACLDRNISLIWMNAEGIQRKLVRMSFQLQVAHVLSLLQETKHAHPCHLIWISPEERVIR